MTNKEIRESDPIENYTFKPDGVSRSKYYANKDTETIVNEYADRVMNYAREDQQEKVMTVVSQVVNLDLEQVREILSRLRKENEESK